MSGSFINEKANVSWILNQYRPEHEKFIPLQATAFGCSSLAATAQNYIAMDFGKQEYGTRKMTEGIVHSNAGIYSTDKSALGVEWYEQLNARNAHFNVLKPKVTVPNIYTLRRDSLL